MEIIDITSKEQGQVTAGWLGSQARSALLDVYPRLSKSSKLLPSRVFFGSFPEIYTAERHSLPVDKLPLYQKVTENLSQTPGFLKEFEKNYFSVDQEGRDFIDYQRASICLPQSLKTALVMGNIEAAVKYQSYLIENMLRILAYRVNPRQLDDVVSFFIRLFMDREAREFVDLMGNKMEGKDARRFKARMGSFLSETFTEQAFQRDKAHLETAGARTFYVREGQSLVMAEFSSGTLFDSGIVLSLAEPVKKALFGVDNLGVKPPEQIDAEKILGILELRGEAVAHNYVHSKIAQLYYESDSPRLNPFRYGELAS